ncbi:hypothetical protein N9N28_00650 [Rubripirellula amarantea]|uniref:Uncharacterized protein n=1 Tax=Rubripirellula amarantea TaxID=2527999 RepID=A0A5C5WSE3_9BACT|nr:hypothetical protein [Rubripirellula amarantea]MDA8743114.1 hypothetical protein [Rubripirellula amarantea]TWT53537.1 hypothetical protein Pla22_11660 [Rubripirellula amarantea]
MKSTIQKFYDCIRTSATKRVVLGTLAVGLTATSATADWKDFWHNVNVGYHRNNAWPDPFNEVDAMEVITPFETMKQNGWKLHNTIGHELFREGDGALLASGNQRVRMIAQTAPESRRAIYVVRGNTPSETDARVAAVRQSLVSLNIPGPVPNVMVTGTEPPTASGAWAGKIGREWLNSMPKPELPQTSISGEKGAASAIGE